MNMYLDLFGFGLRICLAVRGTSFSFLSGRAWTDIDIRWTFLQTFQNLFDTLNIPNEPFTKKSCRKVETFRALIKNIFAFVSTKAKNPAYPARLLAPHQSHQSRQPGPQNRCTRRTCARWTRKLISFKS